MATGANHPASHSSAFRRGPGTPAGAPTGDQSTVMHVTPKPPLVRQDRMTSRSRRTCKFSLSINRFLAAFWAAITISKGSRLWPTTGSKGSRLWPTTGSKGSRLWRGAGRSASIRLEAPLPGDLRYWQPRLIGAKTGGAGGLAAAVGEDDREIGDDDRAHRRNRPEEARDVHEQGHCHGEANTPDCHHDQVPALPVGNIFRQRSLGLGDEMRASTTGRDDGSHNSTLCRG